MSSKQPTKGSLEYYEAIRNQQATIEIEDVMNVIIGNDERQQPIVTEDVFVSRILPLLVHPWNIDNLRIYQSYVIELTNPLRVAGLVDGKTEVLFTVPPLYPRPDLTRADGPGTATLAHVFDHIAILRSRTSDQEQFEPQIAAYLHDVSVRTPIEKSTLGPLALILARYGRVFEDAEGNPLYTLDGTVVTQGGQSTHATAEPMSSIVEGEYED
ncbi:hypothetical protein AVT69_gp059 [Pseudomonas phage PhiPA3]|uniref:Uncharacterized protein 058 n=1 Tax=Pseudomonas phage PhiPA3 TaxID=998086 RepID=F8SJU0_BPPA3|nr:hypothetical protein AVT69_gp059 [Pseudomonas phage PhiPA3]AEH03485.1 hypothetical protein [Pseudomonas phage PhiPA3]